MKKMIILGSGLFAALLGLFACAQAAIGESWIISSSGCKLIAPHPVPGGSVAWDGQCAGGFAAGHGTLRWSSGDVLEGTMRAGRFEGELTNGHREGIGRLYQPDGDRYEGEFKHDQPEGHGVLTAANGDRFAGEFKEGHPEGRGIQTRVNAKTLAGVFAQKGEKLVLVSQGGEAGESLQQCKDRCGDHRKSCGSSSVVSSGPLGSREVGGPDPSAQCYDPSSVCYVTCEQQYAQGAMVQGAKVKGAPGADAQMPEVRAMLEQQHERVLAIQRQAEQQRRAVADSGGAVASPDGHCMPSPTGEQSSPAGALPAKK